MLLRTLPVLPALIRKLGLDFHLVHLEALIFQFRTNLIHLLIDEGGSFLLLRPDHGADFALAIGGESYGHGAEFHGIELDFKTLYPVPGRTENSLFNLVQRLGRKGGGQTAGLACLRGGIGSLRHGGEHSAGNAGGRTCGEGCRRA